MGELGAILRDVEKKGFSEQIWIGIHNTLFRGDTGFDDMKKWAHDNNLVFSEETRIDPKWGKSLFLRFRRR